MSFFCSSDDALVDTKLIETVSARCIFTFCYLDNFLLKRCTFSTVKNRKIATADLCVLSFTSLRFYRCYQLVFYFHMMLKYVCFLDIINTIYADKDIYKHLNEDIYKHLNEDIYRHLNEDI